MIQSLPTAAGPASGTGSRQETKPPIGVETWLLVSAFLSAGGWMLSAAHQLNPRGYAALLLAGIAVFFILRGRRLAKVFNALHLHRLLRRFRKPLPQGFLLLAIVALVGGSLYRPTNYDALAYRLPRVFHWLAHGQWHWVHTEFNRLNVRACGYEWLMAPLLALTKSDRLLFLPSLISFLLLPGLFYSVFIRFGVKRRVAWQWMWIAATGYGYVTQAGSIANDLLGATYALAALDFGLRLRLHGKVRDLRWFVLATGLLTGAKASNFPLLLPLFLLFVPRWKMLFVEPLKNLCSIALAALASFLPTAIFNLHYAHDWTGMKLEGPMKGPLAQFGINFVNWFIMNLSPPIFPFSGAWENLMRKIPHLSPEAANSFGIPELSAEEGAGLGVGIVLLLAISVLASWRMRRGKRGATKTFRDTSPSLPRSGGEGGGTCRAATPSGTCRAATPSGTCRTATTGSQRKPFHQAGEVNTPLPGSLPARPSQGEREKGRSRAVSECDGSKAQTAGITAYWKWVLWSPYISLAVFAFKAQTVHSVTRIIIPYYAMLLVPWLVFCFDERILLKRWWKGLVGIVFAIALVISILAPARPLWPAETVLNHLHDAHPSSTFITRAKSVCWVYKNRPVAFDPLIAALPADAKVFGLFTFDDPEASLWWPMGSRRIEHLTLDDTRETLEARGIRYVIAPAYCGEASMPADKLVSKYGATVYAKVPLFIRNVPGLMDWYVIKLPQTGVQP